MKFIFALFALFAVAYAADTTKDTLIADASALKELAAGEIAKLLAGGKTVLAKELQVLDDAVVALEKRVEAEQPTTEVGKIALSAEEAVLKGLEAKLHDFITKASGSFYDAKEDLIAGASVLKELAGGEIAKLLAGGKTVLAKELQVLDDAVVALEKRVEAQQPTTELGKIALSAEEAVLKGLEAKLEDFIKKNSGTFYEDTKETLLADASLLKELAAGEIAKLLAGGKTVLAKELQVLDDAVVALEKRVEAQQPTTELGKIALSAEETVLKGLEAKLHDFITKASGSFYDAKEDLIAGASVLKELAGGEIAKLLAGGKTVLAKELQVLDDAVVALEKRVEAQQPTTELGKIALMAEETVLKGLEAKLEDFIKKNSGTFYEDTKETLLADASLLKELASGEIAKLLAGGKTVLAKELQVLDDAVVALEKRVEAQQPTTELGKIALSAEEAVLKGLEAKLHDFITKASGAFFADTKETLLADASLLKELASGEITKLLAGGKTVLAHELQVLDDALVALEKRVEAQQPTTEIGKIALSAEETVLKALEAKLHDFITKEAGGSF